MIDSLFFARRSSSVVPDLQFEDYALRTLARLGQECAKITVTVPLRRVDLLRKDSR